MKKLLVTIAFLLTTFAHAADFYADGYRFDSDINATQKAGISGDRYNFTVDFAQGGVAIGSRHYIAFTNLEFGVLNEVSYKIDANAVDYRVANIADDIWFQYTPYAKIGSKLFATFMYDTTNHWVVRVGFNLY